MVPLAEPRRTSPRPGRRWDTLIVDDEPRARELYRAILEPEPEFRIVGEAADGNEAVNIAARVKPSLILLDLRMPGVDGFEALPRLRKVAPEARIVVLSVLPADKEGAAAFWLGASHYVEKANDPAEFLLNLRNVLAEAEPSPPPPPAPRRRLRLRKPPN